MTRCDGRLLILLLSMVAVAGCPAERRRRVDNVVNTGGAGGDGGEGGAAGGGGGGSGGSGGRSGGSGGAAGRSGDAGPDAAGDGGARVQLKVAWWGSDDRHQRTMRAIELFERKYPNISIVPEYAVSELYWPRLRAHAEAGTLPDVMQQDYAYIEEWTARSWLVALDPLVADGTIGLGDVPEPLVRGGRVNGELMGLSLGANTQCWVLDVDAFTRAGHVLPADNWLWEDFERIAVTLHEKLGIWGHGVGLAGHPLWKGLFLSAGKWVFNETGTGLGYSDDTPWVEHLKLIRRLERAGAIPTRATELADYEGKGVEALPLVTGKAAMEYISSNQLVAIWKAAGEATRSFKLVAIPQQPGGGSGIFLKPSQFFSITAASRHPREAALFLDFFTNDVPANQVLQGERGVPISSKVVAALRPTLPRAQTEAFDLVDRVTRDARPVPRPDPPAYNQIISTVYVPKVIDPVLAGTITPEEGAALFRREATAILAAGGIPDGGARDAPVPPPDAAAPDAAIPDAAMPDGPPAETARPERRALLVVGNLTLIASDLAIQARIAQRMPVDVVLDSTATAATAAGKALVVITASSTLAGVGAKFRDVTVPVIVMEPNIMPLMRLTADIATAHGATGRTETQVAILAAAHGHPLAAGFTGAVTVYTMPWRLAWGIPGPDAVRVASVPSNAGQSAIFAYPPGANMVGGPAPAKRIGFFIHDNPTANLAENGLLLLDAAVDWAVAP